MRIESLELFLSVAACGSISRTAQQHFISQQGVSSTIKNLERDFGTKLFIRSGSNLKLTREGKTIAQEAKNVVDSYRKMMLKASAQIEMQSASESVVEILTTPFVSSALNGLFADYDSSMAGVRLRLIEHNLFTIVDDFAAGSAMALRGTETGRMPLRIIAVMNGMDRTIEKIANGFSALAASELVVACPLDSPLARKDKVTRQELCEYPLVYYSESFLNRIVARLFKGYTPDIRQNTSNLSILNRAIKENGAATFADSFSVYLGRKNLSMTTVPIEDSVTFTIGFLGEVEQGSPEARFEAFLRRYLLTACSSYMDKYGVASECAPRAQKGPC